MKSHYLPLVFALAGLFIVSRAQAGDPVSDEARLATVEKTVSRQEARAAQKQGIARARATGELGNEWSRQQNTPRPVAGTHESRKAERKEIRADLKSANRRGEIPMVTEAGLGVGH